MFIRGRLLFAPHRFGRFATARLARRKEIIELDDERRAAMVSNLFALARFSIFAYRSG